jgi:ribosomal protein S18 acetylase RimI-like enzyme
MNDLTIREATLDDAATVATLFSEFNALLGADGLHGDAAHAPEAVHVSTDQMAARLSSMQGIEAALIAETPAGPAGLCCLRLIPYVGQDAPYAEVTQLYVRAAHKRHGIGAALLREAERHATAAGATCVHIITGASDNDDAQAFYRAQGYVSETVVFDKYFPAEDLTAANAHRVAADPSVGSQHAGTLRMGNDMPAEERQAANA